MSNEILEKVRYLIYKFAEYKGKDIETGKFLDFNGIPLFWFLKDKLIRTPFNIRSWNLQDNINAYLKNKKRSILYKINKKIAFGLVLMYLKFVFYFRWFTWKLNRPETTNCSREGILFQTYADQIRTINDKVTAYRLSSIIEKIKKDNKFECNLVSIQPLSYFSNIKPSMDFLRAEDFFDDTLFKKSLRKAREYNFKWKRLSKNKIKKILALKNKSFYPYIEEEFNFLFSEEWLSIVFLYYYTFEKIIKQRKIKLIFSTWGLLDECAHAAAHTGNIPSVIIQHGPLFELEYLYLLEKQYYFTFGKPQRKIIAKYQNKEALKRIIATGTNLFEDLKFEIQQNQDISGQYVLLFTQPVVEDNYFSKKQYSSIIETILKNLKNRGFNKVKIKLHPAEKLINSYYNFKNRFKDMDIEIIRSKSDHNNQKILHNLIKNSLFCISFGSTCMIDTILMNKLVVYFVVPGYEQIGGYEYNELETIIKQGIKDDFSKVARIVNNKNKLTKVLNKNRREIEKYLYQPFNGTENIVKEIYRIAGT
ncbi:hypothetical protein JXB41_00205 [Candidatus Woesearchaeota archaeon]|nr:hypothetical protein [Candidatus Woesearchaeota archaeon]